MFLSTTVIGQNVDKIIKTQIYTSYFSYQVHNPLFVSYKLYHGGGTCSRSDLSFETDGQLNSATKSDYAGNGYDIGHMANAEDFSYDCNLEKLTFRFYNALPQTPKLNRGIWKEYETKIRKESQKDTIFIICGGYNFNKKIGNCSVPAFCFKIYKNIKTNETHFLIFPNDNSDTASEQTYSQFFTELPIAYSITIKILLK